MRRTRAVAPEQRSTRLPIPEGCLISELSNGQSGIYNTDYTVVCGGVYPTRMSRVQCWPAGKLPDNALASEWRTEQNGPKAMDGAGGGPAEERTWARGRGAGLLKIGESRTRMRGRDDIFE